MFNKLTPELQNVINTMPGFDLAPADRLQHRLDNRVYSNTYMERPAASDREATALYREHRLAFDYAVRDVFKANLEAAYETVGAAFADKLYAYAWEASHSEGFYAVSITYAEILEIFQGALK